MPVITNTFLNYLAKSLRKPISDAGTQKYQIIIKTITKFIQNGLILLLLSQYIKIGGQELSDGNFNSFSDYWYLQVGSELVWALFMFSIVTYTLKTVAQTSLVYLKRIWDRGLRCSLTDESHTKKLL